MLEIEHHCNLTEITGSPGLSWSVCKPLYINHIKDTADEQISSAGRKLPWRKSSNAPDIGDTGRPECHCRCLWAMPAPRWVCWSHSQSPITQQCPTITTFPITKSSLQHQGCTHLGFIGPIWKHHHFHTLSNPFLQSLPTWRWWHCAGGFSHALVSPGQEHGQLEEQGQEIPCIQLSSSSTHPWRMRQTHPVPFLTITRAWLLVLSISKNRSSCLFLLQSLIPISFLASDIYFLVGISFFFQWLSYAQDLSDFNNLQIMSLK